MDFEAGHKAFGVALGFYAIGVFVVLWSLAISAPDHMGPMPVLVMVFFTFGGLV